MKKKVLMSIVLLAIIGTSAVFAQKVGDSVQLGGKNYAVDSVTADTVLLRLRTPFDGILVNNNGWTLSVNGGTGVITDFGRVSGRWADAINKGYYKIGDQLLRNVTSTSNSTWSGQYLEVSYNRSNTNVATGVEWVNVTISWNANGQTLSVLGRGDDIQVWYKR